MQKQRKNLEPGAVFGLWTVVEPYTTPGNALCRCACGAVAYVNRSNMTRGGSLSCGCQRDIETSKRCRVHGKGDSPVYGAWRNAISRCHDPDNKHYTNYGARGIYVCEKWRSSFEAFLADVGEPPFEGATLDRINNDRGYEPTNVRWATRTEQLLNRRNTVYVQFEGKQHLLYDLCASRGIPSSVVRSRLYRGWSLDKALSTPKGRQGSQPSVHKETQQ